MYFPRQRARLNRHVVVLTDLKIIVKYVDNLKIWPNLIDSPDCNEFTKSNILNCSNCSRSKFAKIVFKIDMLLPFYYIYGDVLQQLSVSEDMLVVLDVCALGTGKYSGDITLSYMFWLLYI